MKKLSKIFTSACFLAAGLTISGCKKILDIDAPVNEKPTAVVFSSQEMAKGALSGAYNSLSSSQTYSENLTDRKSVV